MATQGAGTGSASQIPYPRIEVPRARLGAIAGTVEAPRVIPAALSSMTNTVGVPAGVVLVPALGG